MSDNGRTRKTFLDKLLEVAEAVPSRVGRFFNSAFKMVLGGSAVERIVRQLQPTVEAISALEPEMQALSDQALSAKTEEFRNRLAEGETLDDLLVEAFAVVREVARRLEGHPYPKRHFDVQLLGGIVLHRGKIAEMITGEGKTLVATLPAYLNALSGHSVHIITVNDYLARRDAAWMSPVYEFLGMSVGAIQSDMDPNQRQPVYACDIVYGTNNEFGFDYLRDNMKTHVEDQVQRKLHYAIIDEVDSALIDEARTPLIISGMPEGTTEKYYIANRAAQRLQKGVHYEVKEKERTVTLSEDGILAAQKLVGVTSFYTGKNVDWPHYIDNALKAKELFRRDREYVVRDGEVLIVDEFTGRLMAGRRWSDGLHQAVEAHENLRVREENQTLATITFQNFFRLYDKLSGMTGTALTEAAEFAKIYDLEVVPIPPNKPLHRVNHPDLIFATDEEKVGAIIDEIAETATLGRPVLVGTVSVERSEMLADRLKRRGVPHVVLNAKYHKRESAIVAQAGEPGAVTIATNMAGRGTDIVLGGNPTLQLQSELETQWAKTETEAKDLINVFRNAQRFVEQPPSGTLAVVLPGLRAGQHAEWDPALSAGENIHRIATALGAEMAPDDSEKLLADLDELEEAAAAAHDKIIALGGLHIVGTERHEARRIDNQLRGRAGRQGDPGSSRFFLSLEDDLMRIFMGEWVRRFMQKAGLRDGQAIEAGMVSRAIERAQKKVEEQNFNIRKHLLEYDEVMDEQRKLVYGERQAVLEAFRERPAADIASEIVAEFVAPDGENGERSAVGRSFQPARAAIESAVGVAVTEDRWRSLGLRELCEEAAHAARDTRPSDDEIEARAQQTVAEALGRFDSPHRWSAKEQQARELGLETAEPWPAVFGALLAEKLTASVAGQTWQDVAADWVRRGLDADLALLPADKWDYDAFVAWIGPLPCEIGGAEWGPLLGRTEKMAPLVTDRLVAGLRTRATDDIIATLMERAVHLYLGSATWRGRPDAARLSFWAGYRLGVELSPKDVNALAADADRRMTSAAAEATKKQLARDNGVALYWRFPAAADVVRRTLGAEGRDFAGLAARLEEDFRAGADAFELSKLAGDDLRQAVADAITSSGSAAIYCRGLDEIISRSFHNVIDRSVSEYVSPELAPEECSFGPLAHWATSLDLAVSRDEWLALSRDELAVMLAAQVRDLTDAEAGAFATNCVRMSVASFLASEAFAEDRSYTHLATWAHGRFSFASSPVKLDTALPRKVDARRNDAKQQLIAGVQKSVQDEGLEQHEVIDRMTRTGVQAYFLTHGRGEAIDVEPLARWVNSKLHVSAPAAGMEEMMDIDERTVSNFVAERAEKSLERQKPDRIVADALGAAFDCFLPPETFPDTWTVTEFEEWLKAADFDDALDVYALAEEVHTDMLDIFVGAATEGYGERPPQAVAVDAVRHAVHTFLDADLSAEGRNFASLAERMNRRFNQRLDGFELSKFSVDDVRSLLEERAFDALDRRARQIERRRLYWIARVLILQAIDTRWKDHLAAMDGLKSGIGMRGYAQVDPKIAYKREGYEIFEKMISDVQDELSDLLLKVEIDMGTEVHEEQQGVSLVHGSTSAFERQRDQAVAASQKSEGPRPVRAAKEPNRNDPCPCGSGKKYKHCCMGKT